MKHDDNVTPGKEVGHAFMSPNVRGKLAQHVDHPLYGNSAGILGVSGGLATSGRKNHTSETPIQFLTPRKADLPNWAFQ